MTTSHAHGPSCACHHQGTSKRGVLASLLPVISCAFCPTCLVAWKPVLALMGIGLATTERQHAIMLFVSLAVSLAFALWDAVRHGRWLALALTAGGSVLMLASHFMGDISPLEWSGLTLMVMAVFSRWFTRPVQRPALMTGP